MIEIMQSIRPEWIQKFIDGEKTVEVRKTRPIAEPPYRVYVYCTKPRWPYEDALISLGLPDIVFGGGKVIGEYSCNDIFPIWPGYANGDTCLTYEQMEAYLGDNGRGWGWKINNFTIYNAPRELSDYNHYVVRGRWRIFVPLERAPQSWCYVGR